MASDFDVGVAESVMTATLEAIGAEESTVASFQGWFQHPFGYLLDPDSVTGLRQGEASGGRGGWLGLLVSSMNSQDGGLEGLW